MTDTDTTDISAISAITASIDNIDAGSCFCAPGYIDASIYVADASVGGGVDRPRS